MKKTVLASIAAIMMIACGDDSGNNTNSQNESSQAYKVPTIYELGTCSTQNNGQSILVESENAYYICNNNEWKKGMNLESNQDEPTYSTDSQHSSSSELSTISSSIAITESSSSESKKMSEHYDCSIYECVSTEFLNPDIEYGELLDERDNHVYRTVIIGNQEWMAQSLYFRYPGDTSTYYYTYSWSTAMDSAALYSSNAAGCGFISIYVNGSNGGYINDSLACTLKSSKVRGICPKGWHLPSEDEWDTLLVYVHGGSTLATYKNLMSKSGWPTYKVTGMTYDGNGIDIYGFSAINAFYYEHTSDIKNDYGDHVTYWGHGLGVDNVVCPYHLRIFTDPKLQLEPYNSAKMGAQIRCVKD